MCPCACSPEGLTISIRRPGREGANATGRGVLSMSGLSHGVVRVDQENSLTSLTLQDCGQVLPGGTYSLFNIKRHELSFSLWIKMHYSLHFFISQYTLIFKCFQH